jgi:hypothetical protein
MKQPLTHVALARRYFSWCERQIQLAEQTNNPKVRGDHLALANYYLKLAEGELTATQRQPAA